MDFFNSNKSKSFDDIKDEYLSLRKITREKGTFKGDRTHMRVFEDWLISQGLNRIPLRKITKYHIGQFSEYLAKSVEDGGRYLDRGTCVKYYDSLCNLYRFAEERDIVTARPLGLFISPPQRKDNSAQLIPPEKLAALFSDMEQNNFQLYLASILLFSGYLRPRKELRERKVKDFNLQDGYVRIPIGDAKVSKTRIVTLPPYAITALKTYGIETANPEDYIFGKKGTFGKKPISENMFCYHFNKFSKKHGLPSGVIFYSLKHVGAKEYLRVNNNDIMGLMRMCGHSKVSTTQKYVEKNLGFIDIKYQKNAVDPRNII